MRNSLFLLLALLPLCLFGCAGWMPSVASTMADEKLGYVSFSSKGGDLKWEDSNVGYGAYASERPV